MRVRIDQTKCTGYGNCAKLCPEIFKLDEWGFAFVEGDGLVPEGLVEAAREAVSNCPVEAILSDD